MISVIVQRPPADKQGPEISDPLITSEPIARARGSQEIDRNYSNREEVQSTGPFLGFVAPGSLVEVANSNTQPWRGLVRSTAIVIDRTPDSVTATINLKIEREAQKQK